MRLSARVTIYSGDDIEAWLPAVASIRKGCLMTTPPNVPIGAKLQADIEHRPGTGAGRFRARVRWYEPGSRQRRSKSETFADEAAAQAWIEQLKTAAARGIDPTAPPRPSPTTATPT